MTGTHATVLLWQHILGDSKAFLAVFSGHRPAPGEKELDDVEQRFFTWPSEAEKAADWLVRQDAAGRESYYCAHRLTGKQRTKGNAAPLLASYVDGDGAPIPPGMPQPTAIVRS